MNRGRRSRPCHRLETRVTVRLVNTPLIGSLCPFECVFVPANCRVVGRVVLAPCSDAGDVFEFFPRLMQFTRSVPFDLDVSRSCFKLVFVLQRGIRYLHIWWMRTLCNIFNIIRGVYAANKETMNME